MGKVLYAAVSYALFLVAIVWTIGFLANSAAPKTIDVQAGTVASLAQALVVDGASI
jgi:hypothetical protein